MSIIPIPNIQTIELSDTLSKFVEKCNNNFSEIAKKGGGPAGTSGEKGDPGMPTKPKVPIHVWKKGTEYKFEAEVIYNDNTSYSIPPMNLIRADELSNDKYQEGHLILLENGHVYILEISKLPETKLILNYLLTLQFDVNEKNLDDIVQTKISDIENKAKEVTTTIENKVNEINTLQSGSLNLLDRTEFEKYNPISIDDRKTETELITKSDINRRNFTLHYRNAKNIKFEIIDKSDYNNQIYTNSFKIDATNFEEKIDNGANSSNYFDITQQLNIKKSGDNTNYTILKPLTTYTLHCKYKCTRNKIDENSNTKDRGGLYITRSNPIWKNVNGQNIIDYNVNNTSNHDLETLFVNDVEDWTPITIKFTTNEYVGKKLNDDKTYTIEGCTLFVRVFSGCVVEICELKLEEGDIHTSWTPSLADITSKPKTSLIYYDTGGGDIYIKNCKHTIDTLLMVGAGVSSSNIHLPSQTEINNGYVVKIKFLPNRSYSVDSIDARIIGINNRTGVGGQITIENSYSEFTYFGENTWCQTK